jgi:hypothetical protein
VGALEVVPADPEESATLGTGTPGIVGMLGIVGIPAAPGKGAMPLGHPDMPIGFAQPWGRLLIDPPTPPKSPIASIIRTIASAIAERASWAVPEVD